MNIMKYRWVFLCIFLVTMVLSLVAWLVLGLNQGIDFTGGSVIRYRLTKAEYDRVNTDELKKLLTTGDLAELNLKPGAPQPYTWYDVTSNKDLYGVIVKTREFKGFSEQRLVVAALDKEFGAAKVKPEITTIDPTIGKETVRNAFMAVLIASILILIYVGWRFKSFIAGTAGVVALAHDALLVLGVFALFHKEISSAIVAAVLTILGYSINDTIVVFDRIRENRASRRKGETFDEVVNESIVQTMRRSLNTSATTVLAVLVLYLIGAESIKEFLFALIVGITSGTYSSIFVASPIWAIWQNAREKRKQAAMRPAMATK